MISVNLIRINPNGNLMKMTMRIRMIITSLMLLLSATLSAQSHQTSDLRLQPSDRLSAQSHQTSDLRPQTSDRMAAYREAIGLDMTVPDFSTKKIDAKVMGTRLAGILEYLLENFHQGIYGRYYAKILSEQHEALQNKFFNIKKIKFMSASKIGNEITILLKVSPDKTIGDIKQVDLSIHFKDGVSESKSVNDLFSRMSHYVQARENLNQ